MWNVSWREQTWAELDQPWDVVIVGGGITGAGLLREATRAGLRALLVEQRDFAWGTSSRSSKLVHGGLRYLKNVQIRLTLESVRERDRLLHDAPGLVNRLGFVISNQPGAWRSSLLFRVGLMVYDVLARRWQHEHLDARRLRWLAPHLGVASAGGLHYADAQTDDARLVLRVLQEATAAGGSALNYVAASALLRAGERVVGVVLHDQIGERTAEVRAQVVINATGAWADVLRQQIGGATRMRPLRGSHLLFAGWRLPVAQAITFEHPDDGRPVFVLPWEGATIVGTTDCDHSSPLNVEPQISADEAAYLLRAVQTTFPSLNLAASDVISTWSGVRPVVDTGASDPSKESRDHVVWLEQGLLTVTGGKLTTFRLIALDALRALRGELPKLRLNKQAPAVDPVDTTQPLAGVPRQLQARLWGRYGRWAAELVAAAQPGELAPIPGTPTLWAELRWAARYEGVQHLDDLLLRRVRIGQTLPHGALEHRVRIRSICQPELGWSDERWLQELSAYRELIERCYSMPAQLPSAPVAVEPTSSDQRKRRWALIGAGVALGLWRGWRWATAAQQR